MQLWEKNVIETRYQWLAFGEELFCSHWFGINY